MSGRIYLVGDGGALTPMEEVEYAAEEILQNLLAEHPDLMAGEQMNSSVPRRWILVRPEMGVPDAEGGSGRWSLDHLFIDQDGIPTLVEVKRSSDTRVRREVVAQMLDYAANAVVYWPVEQLQADFASTCARLDIDPGEHLVEALGIAPGSEDEFWKLVKTNLRAGRIRMVFVADAIPSELLRIVEFLNEQMDPAEVLAVEVRQFEGEGKRTLVPRVVGQTVEAQDRKASSGPQRNWDEGDFLDDLAQRRSAEDVRTAEAILEWAAERELRLRWGHGRVYGTFSVRFRDRETLLPGFTVYSDGRVEMQFALLAETEAFGDEASRMELRTKLQAIGVDVDAAAIGGWPRTNLTVLAAETTRTGFLAVWEWSADRIRAPAASGS